MQFLLNNEFTLSNLNSIPNSQKANDINGGFQSFRSVRPISFHGVTRQVKTGLYSGYELI